MDYKFVMLSSGSRHDRFRTLHFNDTYCDRWLRADPLQLLGHVFNIPSMFNRQAKDLIMRKFIIALVGALAVSAAFPAMAGPDRQVIEHARKIKLERMQADAKQEQEVKSEIQTSPQAALPEPRMAAMMAECTEMMKKAQ